MNGKQVTEVVDKALGNDWPTESDDHKSVIVAVSWGNYGRFLLTTERIVEPDETRVWFVLYTDTPHALWDQNARLNSWELRGDNAAKVIPVPESTWGSCVDSAIDELEKVLETMGFPKTMLYGRFRINPGHDNSVPATQVVFRAVRKRVENVGRGDVYALPAMFADAAFRVDQ